jgi:hypothetical protein
MDRMAANSSTRSRPTLALALAAAGVLASFGWTPACGSAHNGNGPGDDGGGDGSGGYYSSGGPAGDDGSFNLSSDASGFYSGPCPTGLQCNVTCGNTGTSLSGKVYDPAGLNPLYNVTVFVPINPLQQLPQGIPTGSDACSCPALYKSGAITATETNVDGTFTLPNPPVGANVPLVIQVGKWRRLFHVGVQGCKDNPLPDGALKLPSSVAAGDTDDNIPEIAVSTGSADTLECLLTRVGLPSTEYVAGGGGSGHIHIFAGGQPGGGGTLGGAGGAGTPESPGMSGAPPSDTSLWASQSQLMPYDVVLLSCEGGETYDANPTALEQYLNAGGRVFASHYHYSWFSGPITSGQSYKAPLDWGSSLASWSANGSSGGAAIPGAVGGTLVTTLNGTTMPFAKGQALQKWLGVVGALGQNGVPSGQLSIFQSRYNAQVGPSNTPSQAWIASSPWTMYLSFNTPVNAAATKDSPANYCGRAVYSDLHVAGDPSTNDTMMPPSGCATGPLSPQEKALEFMLFDLSACVIPDDVTPPTTGLPQ